MTIIHLVLFSFKPDTTQEHKDAFLREVKKLKSLPTVKGGHLIVGGPSLTDPIKWSKDYELAHVSYHEDLAALREYQGSEEHHRFTSTYMYPYQGDLCSFDFEVPAESEYMCNFSAHPSSEKTT